MAANDVGDVLEDLVDAYAEPESEMEFEWHPIKHMSREECERLFGRSKV
jgi:hypothetical protein